MNANDSAEVLWAVSADLQWAGDRLFDDPASDIVAIVASATRSKDAFSRRVAAINELVARHITQTGHMTAVEGEVIWLPRR